MEGISASLDASECKGFQRYQGDGDETTGSYVLSNFLAHNFVILCLLVSVHQNQEPSPLIEKQENRQSMFYSVSGTIRGSKYSNL